MNKFSLPAGFFDFLAKLPEDKLPQSVEECMELYEKHLNEVTHFAIPSPIEIEE